MKRYLGPCAAVFILLALCAGVFRTRPVDSGWRRWNPDMAALAGGLGGPGLTSPGGLSSTNTWTGANTFTSVVTSTVTGGNSFALSTGGRFDVGGGANDFWYSDGSAIKTDGAVTTGSLTATNLSLTTVYGTGGSGTGITINNTGLVRTYAHNITIAETALTAAATTQDITIWTLPAKTRLSRIVVSDVTGFTGGGLTAMTVMCGPSGGSATYLVAGSIFTSAVVLGDAAAEIGSSLTNSTVADIPSMTATSAIVCRFTSTTANVVAATAGTATFYIEAVTYP